MDYTDTIAQDADSHPSKKQELIDYIELNKTEHPLKNNASLPRSPEEIEAFFRSFNVDSSDYKFDRKDANVR